MSQELVTQTESGEIALSDELKAVLAESRGEGLEDMSSDDYALPFLKLLQGLSPEVDPQEDSYIDGARPGMIYNSVTRELYDGGEGLEVIPVHIRSLVIEWAPRTEGGGFVAEYRNREEAQSFVTPGNELKDTITYTVLYRPYGTDREYQPALLGMESTKLKVARTWNSQLSMLKVPVEIDGELVRVKPDIYMTRWRLTSVRQENARGKFSNFAIQGLGLVEDTEVIEEAKKLRESVSNQELRSKNGDLEEPEIGEGGDTDF